MFSTLLMSKEGPEGAKMCGLLNLSLHCVVDLTREITGVRKAMAVSLGHSYLLECCLSAFAKF